MALTPVQSSNAFFSPGSSLVGQVGGAPATGTTAISIDVIPNLTQAKFEALDRVSQKLYLESNGTTERRNFVDYKVIEIPWPYEITGPTRYTLSIQNGGTQPYPAYNEIVETAISTLASGTQSLLSPMAPLSLATFQSWSRDQQMTYVKAAGIGDPKTVYFGAETGSGVRSVELVQPNGYDTLRLSRKAAAGDLAIPDMSWGNFTSTAPELPYGTASAIPLVTGLTAGTFQSWTKNEQILYLMTHGQGDARELNLRDESTNRTVVAFMTGSASLSNVYVYVGLNEASQAAGNGHDHSPDPETLTSETFMTWKREDQRVYIRLYGTGRNNRTELTFAPEKNPALTGVALSQFASGDVLTPIGVTGLFPTPGELLPNAPNRESAIPYFNLLGSAGDTGSGAFNKANAEALFPTRDGVTHTLPAADRPAGFSTVPTSLTTAAAITAFIADFGTWHSGFQVEYVNRYGTGTPKKLEIPAYAAQQVAFPTAIPAVIPVMTALLSSDAPTRLIRVEALTKADFATMALADQTRVTATAAWAAYQQTKVGLSTDKATVTANIDLLIRDAQLMFEVASYAGATLVPGSRPTTSQVSTLTLISSKANSPEAEYAKIFTDELDLLKTKLSKTAVISVTDVQKQIDDLEKRLIRAYTFWDSLKDSVKETTKRVNFDGTYYSVPDRVVSLDGGAVIKGGFDTFISQERRLRDLAKARYAVATDAASGASFNGKHFDAATLIYFFQDKYNSELEAQVNMETEYVKQVNDLLKTYAAIQQSISSTLGAFGSGTKDTDTKAIDDKAIGFYYYLTDYDHSDAPEWRSAKLYVMFDDASSNNKHPVELLEKIERPTQNLLNNGLGNDSSDATNWDYGAYTSSQWQTFATKVDNAVTQLNQESQLRMNEINNKDKERNRHYDLANNALSKMNEALQSILRAD